VAATDCGRHRSAVGRGQERHRRREECGGPPTAEQIPYRDSAVSDRSASHPAASMALVNWRATIKAAETGVLAFEAVLNAQLNNSGHEVHVSTVNGQTKLEATATFGTAGVHFLPATPRHPLHLRPLLPIDTRTTKLTVNRSLRLATA